MAQGRRKQTNELEFQGQVVSWLNDEINKRPSLMLDWATQEKPRKDSGKRNDLVVWLDRASESGFLAIELKTPTTPINDPAFFADAIEKARHWQAPYFALWNMRQVEVYATTAPGQAAPLPTDALARSALPLAIAQVEDWLKPHFTTELRKQAVGILEAAVMHRSTGAVVGHAIDADIFVARASLRMT